MTKYFFHIVVTVFSIFLFLNASSQDTVPSVEVSPPAEMTDTVYETSSNNNYQFREVSTTGKVEVRAIPEKDVKRVKSDDDYWYANLKPVREKKEAAPAKRPASIFDKAWFNTLFWIILIGGFLALLIWFLATSNINLFRRRAITAHEENLEEIETENIFEINFEKEIQKAIDAANYRLAIRMMYLRTLKDLSLRNIINYTHEKTNTDYLFHLVDSPYYNIFFRLTRSFDYTWYGHFPVSQESFSMIQKDFNSFKQQLS